MLERLPWRRNVSRRRVSLGRVCETLGERACRAKKGDGSHKRTKLTKIFITGYDLHPGAPRSNPQHMGMRMRTLISRVKLTDYKFKEYILWGTGV